MSGQWNPETQRYEVYSSQTGRMEPTGQDMYRCSCGIMRYRKESVGQAWQHDVSYHRACGYCKCTPCRCDGHGNYR